MDKPSDFKIIKFEDEFVVYNNKVDRRWDSSYHTHVSKKHIGKLLIKLVCSKTVPNNPYLRESARRISRDKTYIAKIERVN